MHDRSKLWSGHLDFLRKNQQMQKILTETKRLAKLAFLHNYFRTQISDLLLTSIVSPSESTLRLRLKIATSASDVSVK